MSEMWKLLPENQIGEFQISHLEINEEYIKLLLLRDAANGREEYRDIKPGKYVKLCKNGAVIMSDTQMEYHTNSEFIQSAHGHVLIAGLGIGLVTMAIQDNIRVKSIVIVEKEQEIIDLVFPHLPIRKECSIVCGDIFNYIPTRKFNAIYFDIWNDVNYDIQDIEILGERLAEYLDASDLNCYMGFWREEDAINYSESHRT